MEYGSSLCLILLPEQYTDVSHICLYLFCEILELRFTFRKVNIFQNIQKNQTLPFSLDPDWA